jgi:hypothetical protein
MPQRLVFVVFGIQLECENEESFIEYLENCPFKRTVS